MNGSCSAAYSPAAMRSTTSDNVASAAGGGEAPDRKLASASMYAAIGSVRSSVHAVVYAFNASAGLPAASFATPRNRWTCEFGERAAAALNSRPASSNRPRAR
jgi:hypothetical protein